MAELQFFDMSDARMEALKSELKRQGIPITEMPLWQLESELLPGDVVLTTRHPEIPMSGWTQVGGSDVYYRRVTAHDTSWPGPMCRLRFAKEAQR